MTIQGLRSTADFTALKDKPENWRAGILISEPNGNAPLFALTSQLSSQSTDDSVYHWYEEETPDYRVALGATITTGTTVFTLVSGALYLKPGDILYSEQTEEQFMITLDPSTDTSLTVTRGFAGTTPTGITYDGAGVNPYLLLLGSAYEEGSDAPEGRSYGPSEFYNYTQIFRNTFEVTNTAKQTRYRTGAIVKQDRRRCLRVHSESIERQFLLGVRATATHNGKPRRVTNGVINLVPSANIFTPSSGDLDMETFEGYMLEIFRYGSSEKMVLCGNRAMLGMNQVARKNTAYEMIQGEKEFGMNIKRFTSPFGDLVIKTHPLFNRIKSGTTGASAYYAMDTWMLVLDMVNLKYRYLKGRDTKFEDNLQLPGKDGLQAGFISECGLQTMIPKSFALIKGLNAGIADT